MATTEPLWTEAKLALTEKKMDMSLDDIIKMSKVRTKGKKQQHRTWNKTRNFAKRGGAQDKPAKVRHYVDTRSAMRQDILTQGRSNFQGNHQFPIAARNTRAFKRKPKACAPFAQRRAGNSNAGFFGNKLPQQHHHQQKQPQQLRQQGNGAPRQMPQTLDTLLANIKEQRMKRAQPRHNNAAAPRSRGGRFGN